MKGPAPRPLAERFWEKVSKSDGCWEWTAAKDEQGRGYIGHAFGPRTRRAAPVSWQLAHGPIPKGLCVCHHCDNPSCVRPDHLFLGTQQENLLDMRNKERRHTTLTKEQVLEIRAAWPAESKRILAARYGVTRSGISHIVSRRSWRHI